MTEENPYSQLTVKESEISTWNEMRNASGYIPDAALADAVSVAVALGQPLLITGEAGTGKTLLAKSIAHELGLGAPLKFETKSTSEAQDLFYTYDSLGRFQAGHADSRVIDYIEFNALGRAILCSNQPEKYHELRSKDEELQTTGRSVVLIDEVDKAPRDFPNDLLNEIEHQSFRIRELGNISVESSKELRPIVVLTSNSEKNLPDAFLRRCVFYHISFPERDKLEEIVISRIKGISRHDAFLCHALNFFEFVREDEIALVKKPATAELLGWLVTVRTLFPDDENPMNRPDADLTRTMSTLLKTREDQKRKLDLIERWRKRESSA